jgi:hypothetical protein
MSVLMAISIEIRMTKPLKRVGAGKPACESNLTQIASPPVSRAFSLVVGSANGREKGRALSGVHRLSLSLSSGLCGIDRITSYKGGKGGFEVFGSGFSFKEDVRRYIREEGGGMEEFEKFWASYPKKRSKGDARKAWLQTASVRPCLNDILKAVVVMCAAEDWTRDGGQYIPYPSTWLRGEGWEDAPDVQLVNGQVWWQTVSGIEAKAKELGVAWDAKLETYQSFAKRIRSLAETNVVPMRGVG